MHKKLYLNGNQLSSLRNNQQTVTTGHMCTHHCAQLSYTTQHRTVLIIFPLIIQTVIIAQMMSDGGEGTGAEMETGPL